MEEYKGIEKLNLEITYKMEIPKLYFDECFNFENVALAVSKLGIDSLKNLEIVYDESNSEKPLNILAVAECSIKLNGKSYQSYVEKSKANPSKSNFLFFSLLLYDKSKAISELFQQLLQYIGWRKKLGVSTEILYRIPVSCHWEINDESASWGAIDTNNTIEFLGVYEVLCVTIKQTDFDLFYEFRQNKTETPLHHELLVEAERLIRLGVLRSGYLMLYTTFEIATKNFISKIRPQTAWIIKSLPSPDLTRIYREYINAEIPGFFSNEELENLRNIGNQRNNLAHQGRSFDFISVHTDLARIKEWINRLEIYQGYAWVGKEVSRNRHR